MTRVYTNPERSMLLASKANEVVRKLELDNIQPSEIYLIAREIALNVYMVQLRGDKEFFLRDMASAFEQKLQIIARQNSVTVKEIKG